MIGDRRPGSPGWEPAAPKTLLADMARVMKVERHPTGFEDSSEQEVQELHASCWIAQGFTDTREVERWIAAGVQAARKAADAVDAGYRPGDPWVETAGPEHTIAKRTLTRPGFFRARLNRRRALREWEDDQHRNARVGRKMVEAAALLDADGASPLAVLDLLVASGTSAGQITPEHVWRAMAELDKEIAAHAHQDDPFSYWETMIQVIDEAADVCGDADQHVICTHLLDLAATIVARGPSDQTGVDGR